MLQTGEQLLGAQKRKIYMNASIVAIAGSLVSLIVFFSPIPFLSQTIMSKSDLDTSTSTTNALEIASYLNRFSLAGIPPLLIEILVALTIFVALWLYWDLRKSSELSLPRLEQPRWLSETTRRLHRVSYVVLIMGGLNLLSILLMLIVPPLITKSQGYYELISSSWEIGSWFALPAAVTILGTGVFMLRNRPIDINQTLR